MAGDPGRFPSSGSPARAPTGCAGPSRRCNLKAGPNLPTLRGEPLVLWEHRDSVLRGFRSMYQLLCRACGPSCSPATGRCRASPACRSASLLRGTGTYAHLLHVAYHPDYLRTPSTATASTIASGWTPVVYCAAPRGCCGAEQAGPRRPVTSLAVESLSTSTDLLHARRGADRAASSPSRGWSSPGRALQALDEADLERQSWLVQASLEAHPLVRRASDLARREPAGRRGSRPASVSSPPPGASVTAWRSSPSSRESSSPGSISASGPTAGSWSPCPSTSTAAFPGSPSSSRTSGAWRARALRSPRAAGPEHHPAAGRGRPRDPGPHRRVQRLGRAHPYPHPSGIACRGSPRSLDGSRSARGRDARHRGG